MSRLAKFDKVTIGEVTIGFLGVTHTMVAKAKLVSTKTGTSFGSTTIQHWSPAVLAKLDELKLMMETEMEDTFFDEGRTSATPATQRNMPDISGGLREFLGEDDTAPSA